MSETYNGFSNYPTYAMELWLSNDEDIYSELVKVIKKSVTIEELAHDLENIYRTWMHDYTALNLQEGIDADLYKYAYQLVNWRELAGYYWDDFPHDQDD